MTTPSALLLAAADRLRDRAANATQGPWVSTVHDRDEGDWPNVLDVEGRPLFSSSCCNGHCYGHVTKMGDADWIATMGPLLAPHLEAWLRSSAGHMTAMAEMGRGHLYITESETAAVKFAALACPELVEDSDG